MFAVDLRESRPERSGLLVDGAWTLVFNVLTKSQALSIVLAGLICGGVTGVGQLGAAGAAATVGAGLADFGFASEAGRIVAAHPYRQAVSLTTRRVVPRALLGGALALGAFELTVGRQTSFSATFVACIALLSAALAVSSIDIQTLNGLGRFRQTSLFVGSMRVVSAVVALLIAATTRDEDLVLLSLFVLESVNAFCLAVQLHRAKLRLPVSDVPIRLGRSYLWLGFGSVISIVTNTSDVLLVGAVAGPATLGVYSIASQLQNAIGTLALSPSVPLAIHVARALRNGRNPDHVVGQSLRATLRVGAVALVLGLLAFFAYLALPFSSSELHQSDGQLAVVICGVSAVAAALAGVYLTAVIGMRAHARVGLGRLVNSAIAIPAFLVLTPIFGVIGAAIAAAARDVTMMLIGRLTARRLLAGVSESSSSRRGQTEMATGTAATSARHANGFRDDTDQYAVLAQASDVVWGAPQLLTWDDSDAGLGSNFFSGSRAAASSTRGVAAGPYRQTPGAPPPKTRSASATGLGNGPWRSHDKHPPDAGPGGAAVRAPLFVALLTLAGVFLGIYPITNRSGLVQAEEYLLLIYSAARLTGCVGPRNLMRMASLVVWLFVYTLFGIVQCVQLSRSDNPFHVAAADTIVSRQLLIILVGCLAFDVAATVANATRTPSAVRREISLPRIGALAAVLVVLTPLLVAYFGGIGNLFSSRLSLSEQLSSGGQESTTQLIVIAFANVAPFLSIFGLLQLRRTGPVELGRRPTYLLLGTILLLINILFNNPITQPRYWIATILIALVIARPRVYRPKFQVKLLIILVLIVLLVFPYLDLFRKQDVGAAVIRRQSVTSFFLNKTDYGSAQDITNAISYVDTAGHTDGRQIVGAALFFVPRSMWSGKPTDTSDLLAVQINFPNHNIDAPLWAEGYIDFGYGGVIALLAVFGWLVGRGDRLFASRQDGNGMAALIVPSLIGYELILLRGSLLQATGRLAVILVIGLILTRRRRAA